MDYKKHFNTNNITMKKAYLFFLVIMFGVTLAACGHDDEPEEQPDEIQTSEIDFYSRTIKGNNVAFLSDKGTVVLNYTKGTIQLTSKYNDFDGQPHTFTTGEMQVAYTGDGTLYTFRDPTMQTDYDGSTSVGLFDTATGVILYTFNNEIGKIFTTTYLNFPSSEVRIGKIGDSYFITHDKSEFLFAPVDQGSKCVLQINNFVADMSGNVAADVIQFMGLPMTSTPYGYTIVADRAESTYGGNYTITDVNISINNQCRGIYGSYLCNGYKIEFAAHLY